MNKIEELIIYHEKIGKLQYLINILDWELKVSAPKETMDYIIHVMSDVELELFKLRTSEEYGQLLNETINNQKFFKLDEEVRIYIKHLEKEYLENKRIPQDFYQEYSTLCSISNKVWRDAKEVNNYELFKPYLKKVIDMTKKYYRYIDNNTELYDVMLEQYEMGMTSDIIDRLFDELKKGLLPLVDKIKSRKIIKKNNYIQEYSESELIECAKDILEYMGFDFNRGTLGIYPHGFMNRIGADDIRIAFKHTNNPISFVSTIVHEGGHGLFEQNIKKELTVFGNNCINNLYALHESQSRFYENILGRNINFWYPIYDKVKDKLRLELTLEEFIDELNKVECSMIRTDADELTYCFHIIIRYEIERDLFSDKITVDELPEIWNQKMREYLGIEVVNDNEGLMQDVHWSKGSFGYFPSYLLGTIYDGMFIEGIENNLGNIDDLLKNGKIKEITKYLIDNIYQYGGAYNSKEVIKRFYDKELSALPIINYFNKKYL